MDEDKLYNFSNEADLQGEDWFADHKPKDQPSCCSSVDEFDESQVPESRLSSGHNPPPARQRLTGKELDTWRWSISVACIILGIVVSLLFKTYRKEGEYHTLYGQRKDLAEMVKYLQTERNKLQADLNQTRQTLSDLENSISKGKDESVTLKKQLELTRQEAGLIPVKGPGIIIRLDDSNRRPKEGEDPNFYIVHDIDLMALINELWATGAEALSINDQRVVMTSAIRCVGPTITVNTVRLAPPYIIKAIGPPDKLETGLRYTGGFMDSMAPNIERGVSIKITREKEVKLPAFSGSLVNRYAAPYDAKAEEGGD